MGSAHFVDKEVGKLFCFSSISHGRPSREYVVRFDLLDKCANKTNKSLRDASSVAHILM